VTVAGRDYVRDRDRHGRARAGSCIVNGIESVVRVEASVTIAVNS